MAERTDAKTIDSQQRDEPDGKNYAVLRKGRANLTFIYVAAHRRLSSDKGVSE